MTTKQRGRLLAHVLIIGVLVIGTCIYYSKHQFITPQVNTQNKVEAIYTSDRYKISFKYPSEWLVKETDPYLQDTNRAQVLFYKNESGPSKDSVRVFFDVRVVKNGDLKFGTRDWQDLTLGTNKFIMNCEKDPAASCEIVLSTTGEIGYVIYANNPNTDLISREVLTSLQIK